MASEIPTTDSIARYVARHAATIRKATTPHGHAAAEPIREADYKGHHIEIVTHYHMTVDGSPITGHVGVNNAGLVHYHAVPNLEFASAIDLVKKLIDVFPADFKRTRRSTNGHNHHSTHTPRPAKNKRRKGGHHGGHPA